MIVVDSSIWIANLRGLDTLAVRKLRTFDDPDMILVGDLVLLEVLQGIRDEKSAIRIESALRQFKIAPMLDDHLAVRAALNYRILRRRGITIRKTIDVVIATFCITRDHALLHDDRDFDPFEAHLELRVL
jgi:predicted nucleic acid-binding protein